jgi:hypothetical protein
VKQLDLQPQDAVVLLKGHEHFLPLVAANAP